jgi:excinuclease UvrABC ATPase subunit
LSASGRNPSFSYWQFSKMNNNKTSLNNKRIIVKGAREHNLKNLSFEIPRNKLVVFTGVSGSGKSSLVFDTIYAEGQRRYVESLSSYARQFLERMNKPDVDLIQGISSPSLCKNWKNNLLSMWKRSNQSNNHNCY